MKCKEVIHVLLVITGLFGLLAVLPTLTPAQGVANAMATAAPDEPTPQPPPGSLLYPYSREDKLARSVLSASNVEQLGQLGGKTQRVFVQDQYAYVDEGGRLTILDVSTSAAPKMVGQTEIIPDQIVDIYVTGHYAYVVCREGLFIIDVANPANPTQVGSYLDPRLYLLNVVVAGNYAYLSDGPVLDISNPVQPVQVSTLYFGDYVAVSGDYAYKYLLDAHAETSEIRVYNISNPLAPQYISKIERCCGVRFAAEGNYLYVANRGLSIYDVSNPATPIMVSSMDTLATPYIATIKLRGNRVYLVGDQGMYVIDVANPASPVLQGTIVYPHSKAPYGFDVAGNYMYLADDSLQVLDIADLTNVVAVSTYNGSALDYQNINQVAVADGYTYLVGDKFISVDSRTPATLTQVGTFTPWGVIHHIAVADEKAYLALRNQSGEAWLAVMDIANPATPKRIGEFIPLYANDLRVKENLLYVAADDGVYIMDISTPSAPVQVAFMALEHKAFSIDVAAGYAYITVEEEEGLGVMDLETMQIVAWFRGHWYAPETQIIVKNRYAYITGGGDSNEIFIMDVSDPLQPIQFATHIIKGQINDMALENGYLYLTIGQSPGLQIVDVRDPKAPVAAGYYAVPGGGARSLSVHNKDIYLVDDTNMLLALRFTPPLLEIPPHDVEIEIQGARINAPQLSWALIPLNTTLPLTLTWETEEQVIQNQNYTAEQNTADSQIQATVELMWSTPGTKTITLTVENALGQAIVTDTTRIWTYPQLQVSPTTSATLYEFLYSNSDEAVNPDEPLLYIPEGAVIEPTAIQYTPLFTLPHPFTDTMGSSLHLAWHSAGHAFRVENIQDMAGFSFTQPITLFIWYPYTNSPSRIDENNVQLRRWDGTQWTGAGITLIENSEDENSPDRRKLQFSTLHSGDFALFGQKMPVKSIYLPLIYRHSGK